MRITVVVGVLLISVSTSWAGEAQRWDELELLDGRVLNGSITREGPNYRIRQGHGSTLVPALAVIRLHEVKDPLEAYEEAAATAKDTEDRVRVAKLAESIGLRREAKGAYQRVLVGEPDHAEARAALGFVKHEGKWLTRDDRERALGKVKFRGAWVSPAERLRTRRAEAEALRAAAEPDSEAAAPAKGSGGVGSTRTRSAPKGSKAATSAGELVAKTKRRSKNSYDRRTPRRHLQLGISTPRRRARTGGGSTQQRYYGSQQRGYGSQPWSYGSQQRNFGSQQRQQRSSGSQQRSYAPPRPRTTRPPARPRPPRSSGYACPRQAAAARQAAANRARQAQRPAPAPLAAPRQVLPLGVR